MQGTKSSQSRDQTPQEDHQAVEDGGGGGGEEMGECGGGAVLGEEWRGR